MGVFESLKGVKEKKGGAFLVLIDPDRTTKGKILALVEAAGDSEVDALLVGSSFMLHTNFNRTVKDIKQISTVPVIIFPGTHSQISPDADAILFTSLISGRNSQYLIDEQVRGAPIIREYGLEVISTGYMLIESGGYTSVQYISNSMPIPAEKHDVACAHALAAQYMGMKAVFMEAGSGAKYSVPEPMIEAVSEYIDLPIFVGGGIRTPDEVHRKIQAGASFVIVGNQLELESDFELLRELTTAAHPFERVEV
ncbi:MAG: geranylgeranylglyceryl/heptaprenylglyceryl phosphate synthase [Candidatus Zixiibacteriota bacterium]|nr:MAG: geranylgeranylglyceryl/heptaprenylglyceryl phosphate synthase [candidate division Zixibacteria bacterium]